MQRLSNKSQSDLYFANGSAGLGVSRIYLWTPSEITTALWLDATDDSTITTSSGNVTEWRNKSGITNTYTPAATGPVVTANSINGLSAMDFLTNRNLRGTRPFTSTGEMFYIQRVPSDTTYLWNWNGTDGNAHSISTGTNTNPGSTAAMGTITLNINGSLVAVNPSQSQVTTALSGNTAKIVHIVNADLSNALWSTYFQFGTYPFGGYHPDNGLLGEFIAISGSVSTETKQKMEGYLAHKWGLTASLPNDHPYKSNQPTL